MYKLTRNCQEEAELDHNICHETTACEKIEGFFLPRRSSVCVWEGAIDPTQTFTGLGRHQ
jgi:hypothetical protein